MIVRIRFKILGGHVHCRMFVGKAMNMTFAKSGEFVLDAGAQWNEFRDQYQSSMEFVHEDNQHYPGSEVRDFACRYGHRYRTIGCDSCDLLHEEDGRAGSQTPGD